MSSKIVGGSQKGGFQNGGFVECSLDPQNRNERTKNGRMDPKNRNEGTKKERRQKPE